MAEYPIWRGWGLWDRLGRSLRQSFRSLRLSKEAKRVWGRYESLRTGIAKAGLESPAAQQNLAWQIAVDTLQVLLPYEPDIPLLPYMVPTATCLHRLLAEEGYFVASLAPEDVAKLSRSELWELDDDLKHCQRVLADLAGLQAELTAMLLPIITPIYRQAPSLFAYQEQAAGIEFKAPLLEVLGDLSELVELAVLQVLAKHDHGQATFPYLSQRLQYNLAIASGLAPSSKLPEKALKLPNKAPGQSSPKLVRSYLGGTALSELFSVQVPIPLPPDTRFEHHMIVAGSGHGKTQTLQYLIDHDLKAVERGEASLVVIDSQTDLIDNISKLAVFAPGGILADKLCLIDPTDVQYPVALNLFDVGLKRMDSYSLLEQERLQNNILELYDFVLGSLLEAGMTQKQSVIFRYITRLLLHIPNATIHTLRELLEEGGAENYQSYIRELQGTARSFFDNEFNGKEFTATKKQVLRRLYGILENQTFERMFSHPKAKLDLFSELNAGKVILINTAKDLLKENGTQIFGRFFIALIAQAAQERAVLPKNQRMPTLVYIDEASEYFDQNIGVILNQARKYNIGMVTATQYLSQMDSKLQDGMMSNTAIKFAGGVSAKDGRALAAEMRTDPALIEGQEKLTFAAFVKGVTKRAVSIKVPAGVMEKRPRMNDGQRQALRQLMREKYAVHYSKAMAGQSGKPEPEEPPDDTGEPMDWD